MIQRSESGAPQTARESVPEKKILGIHHFFTNLYPRWCLLHRKHKFRTITQAAPNHITSPVKSASIGKSHSQLDPTYTVLKPKEKLFQPTLIRSCKIWQVFREFPWYFHGIFWEFCSDLQSVGATQPWPKWPRCLTSNISMLRGSNNRNHGNKMALTAAALWHKRVKVFQSFRRKCGGFFLSIFCRWKWRSKHWTMMSSKVSSHKALRSIRQVAQSRKMPCITDSRSLCVFL